MVANHVKRVNAHNKKERLVEEKWERDKLLVTKWEDYREEKINLTAIFIKVLKRKNWTRRWLIWHKAI